MNAYAVGNFVLLPLAGGRALPLKVKGNSLAVETTLFYDRVLFFGDLRIYIERGVGEHTGIQDGSVYVFHDVDLIRTDDDKLALVPRLIPADCSVFIGSTLDTEYFNATICGEIEKGQESSDNDAVFSELSNDRSKIVYSEHEVVQTRLDNVADPPVTSQYHMVVAIISKNAIIRQGGLWGGKGAYFYTHDPDGRFVRAWLETEDADAHEIENLEGRIRASWTHVLGDPGTDSCTQKLLGEEYWQEM